MESDQQVQLDQQVAEALAELQAAGEHPSVESVARKVGKRTESVLQALRRLTGGTPALDHETEPAQYPEVLEAERRLVTIEAARREAERTLTDRETALARAEATAAEALIDGREAPSLVEARTQVLQAADIARLLELAHTTAKARVSEALDAAQAAHQQATWRHFQALLRAHLIAAVQMIETYEPLRAYCFAHNWAFGWQPFKGTVETMAESWLAHVEALLAQEGPSPGGGIEVPGGQPRPY